MGETANAGATIKVRVLGPLSVEREDTVLSLPRSRKARALLIYLATTAKPQRRDYLCTLLWDVADNPRAALRWCLSRLRELFQDRLKADRETVTLDLGDVDVDLIAVRSALDGDLQQCSDEELQVLNSAFRGRFGEGLELPDFKQFEAWKTAEQNQSGNMHRRLLWELVRRFSRSPSKAIPYLRSLVEMDPDDAKAREALSAALAESRAAVEAIYKPVSHIAPVQQIHFCRSPDGVRIAYATSGEGDPIIKASNWLSHLEFDWDSPVWRPWLQALTRSHRLIRYDQRGNGLSDWEVDNISFDAFVEDLEAVVEAVGIRRFSLLGISQGCALSIAYAARHPEQVTRLILHGGYSKGALKRAPEETERREALGLLTKSGWGRDNPAFRQVFTSLLIPEASEEQMQWLNDVQRTTTTPENALRFLKATGNIDVSELLPKVAVPTIVFHSRQDAMVPFEEGRGLATHIPGARFVALESRNHIVLEHEAAWRVLMRELLGFLDSK